MNKRARFISVIEIYFLLSFRLFWNLLNSSIEIAHDLPSFSGFSFPRCMSFRIWAASLYLSSFAACLVVKYSITIYLYTFAGHLSIGTFEAKGFINTKNPPLKRRVSNTCGYQRRAMLVQGARVCLSALLLC